MEKLEGYDAFFELYFGYLDVPIKVFGSTSRSNGKIFDTSTFVQKPYIRTNLTESNFEEEIDLKINLNLKIYQTLIALDKRFKILC